MSEAPGRKQAGLPFETSGDQGEGEWLSGVIQRVTFQNEENGFCVLRLDSGSSHDRVTVVGHSLPVQSGEFVRAQGKWVDDPRHGSQFRADTIRVSAPSTADGIERYLASGLIHGIGPELAKRMVGLFGTEVLDVIDESPARLREVPGVGEVRLERIRRAWTDQKRVRELMVFLHSHGVGTARAVRIHRTYGDDAVEAIRRDPWALARDIRGIGFATADRLAERLGVAKTDPSRARAGVWQILDDAVREGHCGLPREDLVARAVELLQVEPAGVEEAVFSETKANNLQEAPVRGTECIFIPELIRAEEDSARRLLQIASGRPPWDEIDSVKAVPWVEDRLGLDLAPSQRDALDRALHARLLVLTGGPGVGKTTLVKALLEVLHAKKVRTLLAAPTGRAAKRLAEATGSAAKTLHRLLEAQPGRRGFGRNPENPVECDLLIVDEISMVDIRLLSGMLRALPAEAGLLLIGDPAQLPSVGPGRVVADLIDSNAVPVVRLTEIFRQAAESRIIQAAHRVLTGEMPDLAAVPGGDFFFVEEENAENAAERIVSLVSRQIPAKLDFDPVRDVQVLSPMHRGSLGAKSLNLELQRVLNPAGLRGDRVERFGSVFALGDKVMQVENDYDKDVFNGDLGFISAIDPETRSVSIDFDRGTVEYVFDELDSLALAYATTIHKSQGSEYPAVVFPMHSQHTPMLRRNLVYTAMTRGRRLVIIVGQRRALAKALGASGEERRWTRLGECLQVRELGAAL
ncbi:MAG: ATP-dependent RecD-like DNA helicase [Myxococcota bacterium]|nr:ATP-dependent RecD-like DNA helicase [Myxococcota bacterium]